MTETILQLAVWFCHYFLFFLLMSNVADVKYLCTFLRFVKVARSSFVLVKVKTPH